MKTWGPHIVGWIIILSGLVFSTGGIVENVRANTQAIAEIKQDIKELYKQVF